MRVFADSCIFFGCLEDDRVYRTLRRLRNDGHEIVTSITVIGEIVEVCFRKEKDLHTILDILRELEVEVIYPIPQVRFCCIHIDEYLDDAGVYGASTTDKTHLAYAIAHQCDFFLTSPSEVRSLRKPDECTIDIKIVDIEKLRDHLGY